MHISCESTKSVNDTEYHPKCSKMKNKTSTTHRGVTRRIRLTPTTRVIGHRRVHANAARHVNRHGRYENIMLGAACVRLVPRRHSSRRHENAPALAARRAFSRADRGSNDAGVSRCASFPLHFSLLPPFLPYPRGGLRLSCDECWPIAREAFYDYGALSIIENRE